MMYKAKFAVLRSVKKHWTLSVHHVQFFGAEPFIFQVAIQKFKDQDI